MSVTVYCLGWIKATIIESGYKTSRSKNKTVFRRHEENIGYFVDFSLSGPNMEKDAEMLNDILMSWISNHMSRMMFFDVDFEEELMNQTIRCIYFLKMKGWLFRLLILL